MNYGFCILNMFIGTRRIDFCTYSKYKNQFKNSVGQRCVVHMKILKLQDFRDNFVEQLSKIIV